jgi:hypothetical protein
MGGTSGSGSAKQGAGNQLQQMQQLFGGQGLATQGQPTASPQGGAWGGQQQGRPQQGGMMGGLAPQMQGGAWGGQQMGSRPGAAGYEAFLASGQKGAASPSMNPNGGWGAGGGRGGIMGGNAQPQGNVQNQLQKLMGRKK